MAQRIYATGTNAKKGLVFNMKKKLSCLLIAIAMLAGMSSCMGNKETGIDTDVSEYNMTLTLWLPTSEDTTTEAVSMVEDAINKITKKSCKTAVKITAIPEDEYDEKLKEKIEDVEAAAKRTAEEEASRRKAEKEAKKKGETLPTETTEVSSDLGFVTGEDGELIEVFPDVREDQFDIFCIKGYDNFAYYAENGYLSPLDETIDASAKLIKSYIYPTFLEWAKLSGDKTVYAVPNNHVIGDYTYLLINKEQCDKLKYDPSELTTLLGCQQFIEDVGKTSSITPLRDSYWYTGMHFWNSTEDSDQFSVLSSIISDEKSYDSRLTLRNTFALKDFNKGVIMMKELKEQGYIGNGTAEDFGVGIITCDNTEIEQYQDKYYTHVIQAPRATTEEVYSSMFSVSLNTLDVSRSMKIITLINTDPTIRTLLQYGVQGKHWDYNYELTENGEQTIRIISDDYKMNLEDTGNVFMTYPGENIPMSYWESGKQQNLDSMISPLLGFNNNVMKVLSDSELPQKNGKVDKTSEEYLANEEAKKYMEKFAALDKLSADMWKRVDAMTAAEYEASVKALEEEIGDSLVYADMSTADDIETLVGRYLVFYENTFQGEPVM